MSDTIPTPRTDAVQFKYYGYLVVRANFARTLERELAAMTAQRDALREVASELYEWGSHSEDCTISYSEKCTCGFGKAIADWSKAKTK